MFELAKIFQVYCSYGLEACWLFSNTDLMILSPSQAPHSFPDLTVISWTFPTRCSYVTFVEWCWNSHDFFFCMQLFHSYLACFLRFCSLSAVAHFSTLVLFWCSPVVFYSSSLCLLVCTPYLFFIVSHQFCVFFFCFLYFPINFLRFSFRHDLQLSPVCLSLSSWSSPLLLALSVSLVLIHVLPPPPLLEGEIQ